MGPRTRRAVRQWREARGQARTGYLDAESITLLLAGGREAAPSDSHGVEEP